MTETERPSLLAIVRAAVEATGAASGWLLRATEEHFEVVAALGPNGDTSAIGAVRPHAGAAGHALASGGPAALQIRPDDADNVGAGNAAATPSSLLACPCAADDILGVLELADAPAGRFSFDDVEVVALLSDVAGAILAEPVDPAYRAPPPPDPAQLAVSLTALAHADPARYTAVARAITALL